MKLIKPDLHLYFAEMSEIGIWIKNDYDNANTYEEILNLFHKWIAIAEETTNEVKKHWYTASANYIYSYFTNLSFETKKFKQL